LSSAESSRTAITFQSERWRAVAAGVIETAGTTFLLLIAVKYFRAGSIAKGFVASGGALGQMLGPAVVSAVAKLRWSSSKGAALLAVCGTGIFLLMAAIPILPLFVMGSMLGMTASTAALPLLTQIFHENYPERKRGKLFSRTVMIRIAVAAAFSQFAGQILSGRISDFRWLLVVFAVAFALAAFCLNRIPSRPLVSDEGSHPFRALRFAAEDALFRRTLICWMLMGFANLMMVPMRVEMLANPKYGIVLSVGQIAFLTGVVPNLARIVLSPIWGWLFDRANFFALRAFLNLCFAAGILAFFTSNDSRGLLIGAVVFGISTAGGDIAWSLWVTKFAPENRVADYMSVHVFFTGARGLVAPLFAFELARRYSLATLGWVSAGMIVLASALLLPEIKFGRGRRAEALIEEVSE
jgi:MFS family permease